MVDVERMNSDDDFLQCASCLKSSEEIDIYRIEVGKTKFSTSSTKLCRNCISDLGKLISILDIQ